MSADDWKTAFLAIWRNSDFAPLNQLLALDGNTTGINEAAIDWEGQFLTPLFVAVLVRLEDQVPQLIAAGADPAGQCFYEGLLCAPLHAAALRGDAQLINALLDAECDPNVVAEASVVQDAPQEKDLTGCNALHVLVSRDIFSEEMYGLLMSRGVRLSLPCFERTGAEVSGLLLPKRLGNTSATEENIDLVLAEEVKHMIRNARLADSLNAFFEMTAEVRREYKTTFRCGADVDFCLTGRGSPSPVAEGQNEEAPTALLYAAEVGNCDAMRLLLYSGAEVSRTVQRVLPFDHGRGICIPAQAVHLAVIEADVVMLEQLLFFGVDPGIACTGHVRPSADSAATLSTDASLAVSAAKEEKWAGLTLMHLAVITRQYDLFKELLRLECSMTTGAFRSEEGGSAQELPALSLAVLLGDARGCARLLDLGAEPSERCRGDALEHRALREMFGGSSKVGLEEWVATLLSGEEALQILIDQRTDLTKTLNWPTESAAMLQLVAGHKLSTVELSDRLSKTVGTVPTCLRDLQPVHLACLLEQPWALKRLTDSGSEFEGGPPCREVLENGDALDPPLDGIALDPVLLCARTGAFGMLEFLFTDKRYAGSLAKEVPLAPDLTPSFFLRQLEPLADGTPAGRQPLWAWERLGTLELALLHRRADVAVMLARLGADMLHSVDHVAIEPPKHYAVTDACFRGLTPLHLCALLDLKTAAAGLLSEAGHDTSDHFFAGEAQRPQRKQLLAATCTQAWATVDTKGDPEKEPWLWKGLTPLHLALISGSYETAELLVEASTPVTLDLQCVAKDLDGDTERSFSALLLAFERNLKDLHKKIAKRFPAC